MTDKPKEPTVEGWPEFEALPEFMGATMNTASLNFNGCNADIPRAMYESARRAIAQVEAGEKLAEAARRIVAHWQIVSAPATARGISTMGSLTADMEMALAAWEAVNR